jgi:hypothetical protein
VAAKGVPEDVKEFWGEQYVDISIITVVQREISQNLNLPMPKLEEWINRTNELIETHLQVMMDYEWKTRGSYNVVLP